MDDKHCVLLDTGFNIGNSMGTLVGVDANCKLWNFMDGL